MAAADRDAELASAAAGRSPGQPIPVYPEFFNDVFGPVMQPGSSSHTAGPCRLGHLAADLLGEPVRGVRILLDKGGSFAGTFGVMAEDRAMVAGALGLLPDDERLFRALELARERDITVDFEFGELTESDHPNAMKFALTGESGRTTTMVGVSTGGGMVETLSVDGLPLRAKGDAFVLLLFAEGVSIDAADVGVPAAQAPASQAHLTGITAGLPGLLEAWTESGSHGALLRVVRLAEEPDVVAVRAAARAASPGLRVALLRPVLPVVTHPGRKPQLFDTMTTWRDLAAARGIPLHEVAVSYEVDASGGSRQEVLDSMRELIALMRRQARAAYEEDVVVPTSLFKPDFSGRWAAHMTSPARLTEGITADTVKWAYGAGAGIPGVRTVPGPMGGGGGYVYAALSAVAERRGSGDDALLSGMFVAAGVGAIAYSRTAPTGEIIGCTGEAGVCGAMAAAGIVEMVGGDARAAENAASLALQAFTGMPCDPMPGGLCQPCRSRIMAATCMAHVFADMAIAGHEAVLPLHEAIDVADAIGRRLPPELLCTSDGGACDAPSARKRRAAFRRWLDETPPQDRPPGNLI